MNTNKDKIGFRELASLIFIIMGIKAVDVTPISLFKLGKNATWMMPIIWLILLVFPLFFTFKLLKHYKDKNIAQIVMVIFGKYIGIFFIFFFFALFFIDTTANTRSYVDVMSITVFRRTPFIVLLGSLIAISGYIAYRGVHSLTRTCLFVIPIYVLGAILLNILMLDSFNYLYIFPLAGPGLKKVGLGSISTFTYAIEYLYLGLIFNKVKDYKTYRNANIIGFTIAFLYLSMMFMDYIFVLDYYETEHMTHIFTQIVRMTNIGVFINNVDAIYFSLWTSAGMIRFAFYIYVTVFLLGFMFKLDENDYKYLVLPLCVLMLILGLIPDNIVQTQIWVRNSIIIKGTWPLILFLPFILWGVALIKGEFKNTKAQN